MQVHQEIQVGGKVAGRGSMFPERCGAQRHGLPWGSPSVDPTCNPTSSLLGPSLTSRWSLQHGQGMGLRGLLAV